MSDIERRKGSGCVLPAPGLSRLLAEVLQRTASPTVNLPDSPIERKQKRDSKCVSPKLPPGHSSGHKSEKIKVAELAEDFLREYRINGRKSIDDATTRWNLHLKPFFGAKKAIDVSSD